MNGLAIAIKGLIDIIGAVVLLVCSFPILILSSLAILFTMGWPVLFKQKRCGLHGKPFVLYKLRTLTERRDSQNRLLPDEQRLTPIGKLLRRASIDELPGLLNVLKGEMSLVGPRPLLMEYVPEFNARQRLRLACKPGITGWAQINGRNVLSWERKLELDIWYFEHWNLWLDFRILARTFTKVLRQEGISQPGHATAGKFRGSNQSSGVDHSLGK